MNDSPSSVVPVPSESGGENGSEWKQLTRPDQSSPLIPSIFYCASCGRICYSRKDICIHLRDDHRGGEKGDSRKEHNIPELKRIDCGLKDFLDWFLPSVFVEEDVKYFSCCLYDDLCGTSLPGAPEGYFGDFMFWLLTELWDKDIDYQKDIISKLFNGPRLEISWKWYWECLPISRNDYRHVAPTISICEANQGAGTLMK